MGILAKTEQLEALSILQQLIKVAAALGSKPQNTLYEGTSAHRDGTRSWYRLEVTDHGTLYYREDNSDYAMTDFEIQNEEEQLLATVIEYSLTETGLRKILVSFLKTKAEQISVAG